MGRGSSWNRTPNRRNSRENGERVGGGLATGGGAKDARASTASAAVSSGPVEIAALNNSTSMEAAQILSERWTATLNALNNPSIHSADRPVVFSSPEVNFVWGSSKAPLQPAVPNFLHVMEQAVLRSHALQGSNANHSKPNRTAGGEK